MALKLSAPERPVQTLKALAASGSSRFARAAQIELRNRVTEALREAVGK